MNIEEQYLHCLSFIIETGTKIPNRTGVEAYTVPHLMLHHDMAAGFPLLTTKKMAFKSIKVELEGFIKGVIDKRWYQERGCHIWDQWANPKKIPSDISSEEKKKLQAQETDLGPIYGFQWRSFNGSELPEADQLKTIVDRLKTDPYDRRMLCSAWNPLHMAEQALAPCHVLWHLTVIKNKLNLCFFQRSVDMFLGEPFNIASYALLLHLLALESGLKAGQLTAFLSNCHIYENHVSVVKEQLQRKPYYFPLISTNSFSSIYEWDHSKTNLLGYKFHPKISAEVAI
jgi:thymidylate synthase